MTPCAACPRLVPLGVALCFPCLLLLPQVDRHVLLGELRADTFARRRAGGPAAPAPWQERTGLAAAALARAVHTVNAVRADVARRAARAA